MGNSYPKHAPYPEHKEVDFDVQDYSSVHDDIFKYYEKDINLLKYIDIFDFKQLLYNYAATDEERNEGNDNKVLEYHYEISDSMFNMFVEKKIINHFCVFPSICNDDKVKKTAKSFYNLMFHNYYKNYKSYLKKYARISGQKASHDNISKLCLLSLAFVYCRSQNNQQKALFLFNLFANANYEFENSPDLDLFLYFTILTPSNVYLLSINDIGTEFEDLKMKEEKFYEVYDTYEVKDSKRLLDLTIEQLFEGKETLKYNEFMTNIKKLDWLFSTSGIRNVLGKNNNKE